MCCHCTTISVSDFENNKPLDESVKLLLLATQHLRDSSVGTIVTEYESFNNVSVPENGVKHDVQCLIS